MHRKKNMRALKNSGMTAVANNPIVRVTIPAVRMTTGSTPTGAGKKKITTPATAAAQATQLESFTIRA
jgi:hypothetical protein